MGAITLDGILRAEHEMIRTAIDEWIGLGDKPNEDLQWLLGVSDFADKLISDMEGNNAGSGN